MKNLQISMISLLLFALMSCGKKGNKPEPEIPGLISISGVKKERNNKENTIFSFTVNVEKAGSGPISVDYTTVEGTAKMNKEFLPSSGSITLAAGQRNATINVEVIGDSTRQDEKTFYVQLRNPAGATLLKDGKGEGIVISDGTYLPVKDAGYSSPSAYPGYSLVWSDEFSGNSLNSGNWNYETGGGGWGNNELQNYTKSSKNLFVTSGGYLVIEARKEQSGTNQYTSARIQTLGKREFTYGRVDIRAKLPRTQGVWPALWMLGANINTVPWPASGEIDIMELLGHQPNKTYGTLHWGKVNEGSISSGGSYILPAGDFNEKFHVFSLIWTEDKLEWYVDDIKFFTVEKGTVTGNYPFDQPFFLIFNVAVGGNWPGVPDSTTSLPQRMIVDYVRVFR